MKTSRLIAAFFAFSLLCLGQASQKTADPRQRIQQPPDVVLITIDTLRADHVGCYGNTQTATPALDSLARDGVRFSNAFTVSPITNTSHASILTGLYPSSHGVMDFGIPLRAGAITLAQQLKQQGYATAAFIGAVILDSKTLAPGLDRGFDFYDNFPQNLPKKSSRYGRVERRGMDVVQRAERWMSKHNAAGHPRFVWIHLYDPHDPYDPPAPYAQRYKDRPYDGEIAYADSALAELIAFLKRNQRYDQAVIVAVGDHGEGLGEHGEETHGIFLYDSTLHVPLIVKLPKDVAGKTPGLVISRQARTIDVMPTILMASGSKSPLLDGEPLQENWVVAHAGAPPLAIAETDYPLRFGWAPLKSVRNPAGKYIEAPRPEYYNLAADPKETRNIYEPWDSDVQQLRAILADFRQAEERKAGKNGTGNVGQQTIDELKALGYLGTNPGASTAPEPSLLPDPKDKIEVQNLLHTAMLAAEDGDSVTARKSLESVLKLDPKSAAALLQLGQLEFAEGHNARAADLLAQARAERPADPVAAWYEGQARYAEGDLSGARYALEATLKLSTGQFDARLLLGKVYAALKQWPNAQDQLEAATFLNGKKPEARIELARALLAQNKPLEALEQLKTAAQLAPNAPEVFELMSEAQRSLGNNAEAVRSADHAKSLRAAGATKRNSQASPK